MEKARKEKKKKEGDDHLGSRFRRHPPLLQHLSALACVQSGRLGKFRACFWEPALWPLLLLLFCHTNVVGAVIWRGGDPQAGQLETTCPKVHLFTKAFITIIHHLCMYK